MKEEIILHFVHCQSQIRFNHWQTQNYVMHKYLGKLYDKLNDSIDEFIETMIGHPEYGRPSYGETFSIEFDNPSTNDIFLYLSDFKSFLYQLTGALDPVKDTDLLTIRDTILGQVNHTLYFLTLQK
jgi:hypothetical protein